MEPYLPAIWTFIIGFAVAMYVVLDGFDLGIGILFPFTKSERERDLMMASVAPYWDGNETWLVLGGGGLWVAFPAAYSIIMPAVYLPVIIMLLALVLRGVTFEFRGIARSSKRFWNTMFALGSTLAAFCQGVILAGLVQGIRVENGAFAGGTFDFVTPFAVICGGGVVAGYALLGATWLHMKTEGDIAERAKAQARILLIAVIAFMAVVSAWTAVAFPRIFDRWWNGAIFLWPVPVLTAALAYAVWLGISRGKPLQPFFGTIGLFLLGYLGLGISTLPYIVPPSLTIWQTAASPASQIFMLIGTLIMLPLILGYTALIYWIFRGKVRGDQAYH